MSKAGGGINCVRMPESIIRWCNIIKTKQEASRLTIIIQWNGGRIHAYEIIIELQVLFYQSDEQTIILREEADKKQAILQEAHHPARWKEGDCNMPLFITVWAAKGRPTLLLASCINHIAEDRKQACNSNSLRLDLQSYQRSAWGYQSRICPRFICRWVGTIWNSVRGI
jgi:hypothetical protein